MLNKVENLANAKKKGSDEEVTNPFIRAHCVRQISICEGPYSPVFRISHLQLTGSEMIMGTVRLMFEDNKQGAQAAASPCPWKDLSSMNSFCEPFSTARRLREEGDAIPDAVWGSQAGFGNIVKGSPSFLVPNVPDVSLPLIL